MDKHEFISSAFSFELANNPTKAQDYLEQLLKEQKIMNQINYSRDETILNIVNKINQNPTGTKLPRFCRFNQQSQP